MPLITPKIFDSPKWKKIKGASETAVLFALLTRADSKTMIAYPSEKRIAIDTHSSEATVYRAVKKLKSAKCLKIITRIINTMKNGRNTVRRKNSYDLSMWRRFCAQKKDDKKKNKHLQNDASQKIIQASKAGLETTMRTVVQDGTDIVSSQIDASQSHQDQPW